MLLELGLYVLKRIFTLLVPKCVAYNYRPKRGEGNQRGKETLQLASRKSDISTVLLKDALKTWGVYIKNCYK
jgi:hypothetical protein